MTRVERFRMRLNIVLRAYLGSLACLFLLPLVVRYLTFQNVIAFYVLITVSVLVGVEKTMWRLPIERENPDNAPRVNNYS